MKCKVIDFHGETDSLVMENKINEFLEEIKAKIHDIKLAISSCAVGEVGNSWTTMFIFYEEES